MTIKRKNIVWNRFDKLFCTCKAQFTKDSWGALTVCKELQHLPRKSSIVRYNMLWLQMEDHYHSEELNEHNYKLTRLPKIGAVLSIWKNCQITVDSNYISANINRVRQCLYRRSRNLWKTHSSWIIFHFNALDECSSSVNSACWPISSFFVEMSQWLYEIVRMAKLSWNGKICKLYFQCTRHGCIHGQFVTKNIINGRKTA